MTETENDFQRLKEQARLGASHSWSPYSRFPVGAALLSEDGRVFIGCNVENRSLGLTQCAERTALTAAIAAGCKPGSIPYMVIYTPGDEAHPPCGACRQVMEELMSADARVVSCCDGDARRTWMAHEYLPDPFEFDLAGQERES